MSAEATFWAWRQEGLNSAAKLVLLCLADCHNSDTGRCDPGAKFIAQKTCLNKKTIPVALKKLEDLGLLVISERPGFTANYLLNIGQEGGTPKTGRPKNSNAQNTPKTKAKTGTPNNGVTQKRVDPKTGRGDTPKTGRGGTPNLGNEPTIEPKIEPTSICSEVNPEPPVAQIPLIDKSFFPITQSEIDEWKVAYPATEPLLEIRQAIAWCNANPTRRKTKTGVLRFLNTWMSRSQNSGGTKGVSHEASSGNYQPSSPDRNEAVSGSRRNAW